MPLPCMIPWPCIAPTYIYTYIYIKKKKKKSFSFDIMVDVNVYKLYSTCIKYLPSCRKKKKQSNVNRFIIFLREVERKWYKMGEKKQEIMWSWHSVHALINKGLLNKHDWGMFVFLCWFRDAGDVDEESILFSSTTEGQVSSFSLSASSAVLTRSGGCCENYRRRLSGRVHSLFECVFKQKSGPPRVYTETGFACCDRSSSLQCLRRGTKSTFCPHSVQKYTPKFVWRWYETAAVCSGAREPVNLENTSLIWLTKSHINLRWTLEYFFADDEDFVVCPPFLIQQAPQELITRCVVKQKSCRKIVFSSNFIYRQNFKYQKKKTKSQENSDVT